ncbi:FtsB family cell division protein [Gracilibacillus alcaliphilus]|uniref:FtsB family cell division protein n=1 Tax=Gracilibacillus alcaliphilus TaxID=1401441 RepID=UPI00195C8B47|nr:septum formation initiator family protein [Gracilibacillus alcaliphilus]MBM7678143.1 cell division protein DivIC [Gracilibacillus alcaliphilus]
MARRNKVSRINEAYFDQHDAQVKRQKRRKKKLYRRLMIFGIAAAIIMISLISFHVNQRLKHHNMQQQYTELSDQLADMEKEEKQLNGEIELLNDEEYLLQIAKTNYFFTEKGEIVFKLPEEEPSY